VAASAMLLLGQGRLGVLLSRFLLLRVLCMLPVPQVDGVRKWSHRFLMLPMLCMLPMLLHRQAVPRACSMRGAVHRSVRSMRSVQHSGVRVVQFGQAGDDPSMQSAGLQLRSRLLPLCVFEAFEGHEGIHAVAAEVGKVARIIIGVYK